MKENCIVLYSGGMDSTVVLHTALNQCTNVTALTFNYNQKHSIEINKASSYIENLENLNLKHIILNIQEIGSNLTSSALTNSSINVPNIKDVLGDPQTVTYVPNRNLMFLSIAAAFAESQNCSRVFYGAAEADNTSGYWDCTEEFLKILNSLLNLNRKNTIQIEAPLIHLNKSEIIENGIQLGVNFKETHTCYNPDENNLSCGICASCSARIAGFINAGFIDPVKYSRKIPWSEYNCVNINL